MAEKRKRGQNFSADEKDKLVKLIASQRNTILNKKTDGCTNEAKNKAWMDITEAFNASATIYRTKDSLMKIWEKLKSESKLYYQASRRSTTATGGGPSEIKIDPILEQVSALLGRACTGIMGVHDSDNNIILEEVLLHNIEEGNPEQIKLKNNDDREHVSLIELQLQTQEEKNPAEESSSQDKNENHIIKTPLWSRRRRPQISHTNERNEAISSLCSSFNNVNKKKEDIEDLKRQLIQEEIEFKRKLYNLQLEAATKEVEIKTAILNQIKGGALNMENLFGVQRKEN